MRYFKGEPNVHVIRYRNGRVRANGAGLAFWYFQYNTSIALVPTNTQDAQFIFNETTKDFQSIAIQGNLTYRLTAPLEAAKTLDYTIDLKTTHYRTKDPDKLAHRLINLVQAHTRAHVIEMALEAALTNVKDLASTILARVNNEAQLHSFGVLIEGLAMPLLSRAVFVVDAAGVIKHAEYVPEITTEPNYDSALAALKAASA